TLRDAGYQIGDESSRHAPHGAGFLGVLAHLDRDPALVELGHHGVGEHVLELALGALDLDLLAVHRSGDAAGNRNGLFANARHRSTFAGAVALEHVTENFAADILGPGARIRHHAL